MYEVEHSFLGLRDLQSLEGTERECVWIFDPLKKFYLFEILHDYFAVFKLNFTVFRNPKG